MKTEASKPITAKQVAEIIGVSVVTVRAKLYPKHDCYDPSFPAPYQIGPRTLRWQKAEILSWLEKQRMTIKPRREVAL